MSPLLATRAGASARGYGWGAGAAAASAFEPIATYTVTSPQATIVFANIPQTYRSLQMLIYGRSGGTTYNGENLQITFNAEANTSINRSSHGVYGTGGTVTNVNRTGNIGAELANMLGRNGYWGGSVIDIFHYSDTTKNTVVRGFGGADAGGSGGIAGMSSMIWKYTNAVTQLELNPNGNVWQTGSIVYLFGYGEAVS